MVVAPGGIVPVVEAPWLPPKVELVVGGGRRRQDSVAAGLEALFTLDAGHGGAPPAAVDDDRVVLVHDGARPVVSPALVAAVVRAAAKHGAAIPVLPIVETVKRIEDGLVVGTVDRSGLGDGPDAPGRAARPAPFGAGALPGRRPGYLDRRGRPARGL